MKAVVLVGGEGTRLRPLTDTRPKQLLPVVGTPMLERVVGSLVAGGIDEVVLSLGYRPADFVARYGGGSMCGVPTRCVVEPEPLDTGGAIRFAAEAAAIDQTFVVMNGDVLSDLDVAGLVRFHHAHSAAATVALVAVEDPSRFGVVVADADGCVERFVEKPPVGEAPSNLINAGTYVMEPAVLQHIPAGRRVSVERVVFPALAASRSLFALASDVYWLDTGTPQAYLQACDDLLQGRRGWPPAPGARQVAEGLWVRGQSSDGGAVGEGSFLDGGATVLPGTSVRASAIGAGAVVGPDATVISSVVLDGARIEAGARVACSIVGFGAVVGAGAELSDNSVVGDNASVAPGATLRQARIGVDLGAGVPVPGR